MHIYQELNRTSLPKLFHTHLRRSFFLFSAFESRTSQKPPHLEVRVAHRGDKSVFCIFAAGSLAIEVICQPLILWSRLTSATHESFFGSFRRHRANIVAARPNAVIYVFPSRPTMASLFRAARPPDKGIESICQYLSSIISRKWNDKYGIFGGKGKKKYIYTP